jgi:hypothetical protein
MEFVVKATGPGGGSTWLSGPRLDGFRTLADCESADFFESVTAAHTAIAKMPRALEDAGLIFSVESAD